MTIDLPLWLFEAGIYGVAAVVFCTIMLPICYMVGVRDAKKAYRDKWILIGYQQALNSLPRELSPGVS